MKIPKAKDYTFNINGHTAKVSCMCRPLQSNNEKSVYKRVCTITFIHGEDNKTILVTLNMKSAVQLIMNNLDLNTMTVDIFGNKASINDIVIQRNLRLFTIEEIDGKSVYK